MNVLTLVLLIAAVVLFVVAAVKERSLIAAGLACWAAVELVARLA